MTDAKETRPPQFRWRFTILMALGVGTGVGLAIAVAESVFGVSFPTILGGLISGLLIGVIVARGHRNSPE